MPVWVEVPRFMYGIPATSGGDSRSPTTPAARTSIRPTANASRAPRARGRARVRGDAFSGARPGARSSRRASASTRTAPTTISSWTAIPAPATRGSSAEDPATGSSTVRRSGSSSRRTCSEKSRSSRLFSYARLKTFPEIRDEGRRRDERRLEKGSSRGGGFRAHFARPRSRRTAADEQPPSAVRQAADEYWQSVARRA